MTSLRTYVTKQQLNQLRKTLAGQPRWRILIQDNPDPDALSGAAALGFMAENWGCQDYRIVFGGIIGRAENRAMCRYLRLKTDQVSENCFSGKYGIAIVDTQPGTGNNLLPEGFVPHIIIDHHPRKSEFPDTPVVDVRPKYGSVSTLLCQYIRKANLNPTPLLATALMYGIKTDTMNLGRGTTKMDLEAYNWLHAQADAPLLAKIEFARQPPVYYKNLLQAIVNARVYNWLIVSNLAQVNNPEIVAEMADVLIRCEGTRWTLCAGHYDGVLYLSLRADDENKNAGKVMERIVKGIGSGGGHSQMAGAQIGIETLSVGQIDCILSDVVSRLLDVLKVEQKNPVPLVPEQSLMPDLMRNPGAKLML